MKSLNSAAYVVLLIPVTVLQFALALLTMGLEFVLLIVVLLKALVNAFMFWLMPDNMKAKVMAEALARKLAKHDEQ